MVGAFFIFCIIMFLRCDMSFDRLIYNDRLKIECMRKLGYKPKEIADEIGFCLATVYNELKRGKVEVFKNGKKRSYIVH